MNVIEISKIRLWNFWVNNIIANYIFSSKARIICYKWLGIKIGNKSIVRKNAYIGSCKIKIGDNVYIGARLNYDGMAEVEIGDCCNIAPEVMLCTATHEIGKKRRAGSDSYSPIRIGNRCWIGTRATILPGVVIGEGCIIAAGAVVNKNCESNGLYGGVPAKRIKDLEV